ncbi:MAG: agmatinase family protein [Phycisphaerales bacterium]|jgi:agmatinase|nr:agmatinase family protein [Phycisphaerales bacterium]
MTFDPNAPAQPGLLFGVPTDPETALIHVLPVPFDATTSYAAGTARGPESVLYASAQVDLLDRRFGSPWRAGIHMRRIDPELSELSSRARALAEPIIEDGSPDGHDGALAEIERAGQHVRQLTHTFARECIARQRIPAILGGDHSTPLGAILACAEAHPGMGVLQLDAHMDLRHAFEGFRYSHASIMHNVLTEAPNIARLTQVAIRDYCEEERDVASQHESVVRTFFWDDLSDRLARDGAWHDCCAQIIETLPRDVYVSVDIDGLDPALCPHTGTPVPGGLSFQQFSMLIETLARSGRRIVGFDLVEVAPGPNPDEPEWDANVGARALYRLCGMAALSRGVRLD